MIEKAKAYFLFLVDMNEIKPNKAKDILDKWFKDCYSLDKAPSEFNTWYYQSYYTTDEDNRRKK